MPSTLYGVNNTLRILSPLLTLNLISKGMQLTLEDKLAFVWLAHTSSTSSHPPHEQTTEGWKEHWPPS